jgi:hypothetical protein
MVSVLKQAPALLGLQAGAQAIARDVICAGFSFCNHGERSTSYRLHQAMRPALPRMLISGVTRILLTGTVAGPQHRSEYCLDQWWTRDYHLGCKLEGR